MGEAQAEGLEPGGEQTEVRAAIGEGELDEGARAGAVREDFLEGRRVMLLMTEAPVFKHTRLPWHPCPDARVPADGAARGCCSAALTPAWQPPRAVLLVPRTFPKTLRLRGWREQLNWKRGAEPAVGGRPPPTLR